MNERMFPLQTSRRKGITPGPLSIPWSVAEKAYGAYVKEYGKGQSLERLAERGGFGWCEMDDLYPPWREEISKIRELEATVAERDKTIAELERDAEHLRSQVVSGTKSRYTMYVTIASLRECLKNALLDPLHPTTRAIIQRRLEVSE